MPANPKLSSEVHPGTKNFLLVVEGVLGEDNEQISAKA